MIKEGTVSFSTQSEPVKNLNRPEFELKKPLYRTHRYSPSDFLSCEFSTSLETVNQVIDAKLLNLSEYGACISFNKEFSSADDKQKLTLAIHANGESIFSGPIEVKHRSIDNTDVECGVAFLGQRLNFDQIIRLQKEFKAKENFSNLIHNVEYVDRISPEFKIALADFRYFLEDMKETLLEEEGNIKELSSDQYRVGQKNIIDFSEQALREKIHALIWKLYCALKDQPEEDYPIYKQYFQKQLLSLTNDSMLFNRSIKKPRGYSGDFFMMDIVYRNQRQGDSLWSSLINSALTSIPPGQALVNRIDYLVQNIYTTINRNKKGVVRCFSLASGPCEEVRRILSASSRLPQPVEFYFADQDEESLEFAQRNLYTLTYDGQSNAVCYFINDKVKNFIQNSENYKKYPKFDLIYSAGLFDYLSEPVAKQLIATLYKMLDTGGVLIIGNASLENHFHFFIEFAGEWYLIHRSKEDLLKLVPDDVEQDKVEIDTEPAGVVHFLKIRK